MKVLLISANREQYPSPVIPLGMLMIAAHIHENHQVELLDLCFAQPVQMAVEQSIKRFEPEVIGFGIRNLHTNAYDGTEQLIHEYKLVVSEIRRHSSAPLVLGGAGFSLQPDLLMNHLGGDFGVVGEGELAFAELVSMLARGETPPRLAYGHAAEQPLKKSILRRTYPQFHSDLDDLRAPVREWTDERYLQNDGTVNIQTKRGCAFQCSYCDYPDLEGRKIRMRNPHSVVAEMLECAKNPLVTHAFFVDSVFNVPKSHALAICKELIKHDSPLPWVCYGSPIAFDEELVASMAEAGCVGVEIGSDAGTEQRLAELNKPFKIQDIVRSRELFQKYGMYDCHTFVLGAEGETLEQTQQTLDFVTKLDPDVAVFIVFMEDRESKIIHRSKHRTAILNMLQEQAPKNPGWVVPELSLRFGEKVSRLTNRKGWKGPSWLHFARARRESRAHSSAAETLIA
jgi:radical SAM superfamily enzyme YgiQ (UPF0313 family)